MLSFLTPLIVATAPLCLPYCSATPAILRDTAGVKNKHNTQESINLLLCVLHSKIKGRCPQDGGVNFYSQKSYEIFPTPLLRNDCFFGVSPILLMQHPVMLRDTAGEKEERNSSHSPKFMSIPVVFYRTVLMRK